MRIISALTVALSLSAATLMAAPGNSTAVQAFNINSGILMQLYNTANQSSLNISNYPSNMDPSVIQATIKNTGATAYKPCFRMKVTDPDSSCSGPDGVVLSPLLSVKEDILPGQVKVLSANDFVTSGNYAGQLCQSFKDEMKAKFENVDPSKIAGVVNSLLKRRFKVCLIEWDCNTDTELSGKACSDFTIFTPNPGAQASAAILIYPHNNDLPTCSFNFMWTPAMFPGLAPSDVSYQLEISEFADGEALVRIDVPAGQTYYSWGAADRALENGKQYYWKVLSRNALTGATFGGVDGRGFSAYKWFRCGAASEAACRYSLADLDQLVQNRATPDVKAALKGMKIKALTSPGTFNDKDLCKLLNRQAELSAINVTKK